MVNLQIYTQTPGQYVNSGNIPYKEFVGKIARLTDKYNFTGSLIYYHHYMSDPWILASYVLENSNKCIPLIATQPNALPPHSAAKNLQSLHALYGKQVNLNFITGNNVKEIEEIGDLQSHNKRYDRLREYIECLKLMLVVNQDDKVNYNGEFYRYNNFYLEPHINEELYPEFFVAGASSEALDVSNDVADVLLCRPGPIVTFKSKYLNKHKSLGIRIGILARETNEVAWSVAQKRFPSSRIGKIKAIYRSKNETIINNKEIAELAVQNEIYDDIYWMGPYLSGFNNNPYLVGSYEEIAFYLTQYIDCGVNTLLLPDLYDEEEFEHISLVKEQLQKNH